MNKKNNESSSTYRFHLVIRIAIVIICLCVIMTIMALLISSKLYYQRARDDRIQVELNTVHAISKVLKEADISSYISQVREIYENAPADLRDTPADPDAKYKYAVENGEYEKLFDPVYTESYLNLQERLMSTASHLEEISIDISFFDKERQRKVYVIFGLGDDNFSDGYCAPGYWVEEFDNVAKYMITGDPNGYQYAYSQHGWEETFLQCIAPIIDSDTEEVIGFISIDSMWDNVIENRNLYLENFLLVMVIATVILLIFSELFLRWFIVDPIRAVTKEQERIHTELDVASNIQQKVLPDDFSIDVLTKAGYNIFASMKPAKEVGGDFYNFFMLDEDHLLLAIADVSGKGVPAALFMMISKICVDNYAQGSLLPEKILAQTNDAICGYNKENMFVTMWLAVINIRTGHVLSANGGHNDPMVRTPDGDFTMHQDEHGFVLGGFQQMPYTSTEFTLEKGGSIFIYTDGLSEAMNTRDELYGEKRIIDALNSVPDKSSAKDTIRHVTENVNEFVGKAEQFDDMTMLCLTRK